MTDTGQIPGEGLPENAGADTGAEALLPPHTAFPGNGAPPQPDWGTTPASEQPAPGYAYLDHPAPPGAVLDDEDDVLLMPGPQGSWSDPQPVPAPAPVPAQQPAHFQNGQHPQAVSLQQPSMDLPISVEVPVEVPLETMAPPVLGNGAQVFVAQQPQQAQYVQPQQGGPGLDLTAYPDPAAAQAGDGEGAAGVPPVAAQAEPADGDAAQQQPAAPGWNAPHEAPAVPQQAAVPRRPLHMGPPVTDTPSGGVSVRSLADRGPAVTVAGPPTSGPEYLDVPRDDVNGIPAQQTGEPGAAAVVTPGSPWPAAPGDASQQSLIPRADSVPRPADAAIPVQGAVTAPQATEAAAQQPQQQEQPQQPEQSQSEVAQSVVAAAEPVPAEAEVAEADAAQAEPPVEAQAEPQTEAVAQEQEQAQPQPQAPAAVVAPQVVAEAEPAATAQPVAEAPAPAPAPAAQAVPATPEPVVPAQGGPVASQGGGFAVPQPPEQSEQAEQAAVQAAAAPVPAAVATAAGTAPEAVAEPAPQVVAEAEPVPAAPEVAPTAEAPAPAPAAAPESVPAAVAEAEAEAPTEQAPEQEPAPAADPAAAEQAAAAAPGRGRRGKRRAAPAPEEAEPVQQPEPQPVAAQSAPQAAPEAAPEVAVVPAPAPVAEAEPDAEAVAEPVAVPASAPVAAEDVPAAQADQGEEPAEPDASEAPEPAQAEEPGEPEEAPAAAAPASQGSAAEPYDPAVRDAVHRVIRERRDIRNGFRSDPIPHDVLLRVLEAAHTAPSVGHSQPWDFVVIRSEKTREKMHELAMAQREAYAKSLPKARARQFRELKIEAILDTPVNIVVTADPTRGGRHTLGRHTQPQMAPYSSALAVENLWIAARAEGLGVGWVSFFDERQMVAELGLPEHLEVVAYLCVGYVDEFPEDPELMQAGWSQRRPLSWVVHDEEYGNRALPGEEPHDLLEETLRGIRPLDAKALGEAWERQKRMTKPAGALGMLEIISAQLSGLSRQCPPPIPEPAAVAVFAGDHGVHAQGVTAWPQEVTGQMVANILGGGAVCNAFANQVGAEVCVIDVGVASELPATPGLLPRKVRPGTDDFTVGPAMSREDVLKAIEVGIETARDLVAAGNKALLTGEMGIANTTASAAIVSVYTGADPAEVTGRGTGINDEMHARKIDVVRRALDLHRPDPGDPVAVLTAVGGLEHAAMVGLLLGAAALRTPVILDGVSAGAAALVARAIAPEVLAACIAGHRSAEPGHVAALTTLGLRPLVDLDLRLGEGTGALLALPLVQSAARVMHEVATFDAAGVTEKG
ncbi:nicotinate-nucleotide--dimethylbenzimidazole phosphoribosyltransferase [Streptomyces sp. NPDC087270]|uniref:nicotinate-nucleotide--dimethylbenzimidazole phosphoribosyltransferase n=1 Tax=Streptomyces sp. NPDC087270 TaxID=3365774 RepID=UPI00381372F4